jgi:hypothetical protein
MKRLRTNYPPSRHQKILQEKGIILNWVRYNQIVLLLSWRINLLNYRLIQKVIT